MATPIDPRTGLPLQGPPAPANPMAPPVGGVGPVPSQVPQVGPAQTTLQVPPPAPSTPAQPQRANPYASMPRMNPNRAMWTGIINDMANYIGSAGASGFQGLGNQYRQQALAHNMQRTGLMDQWERQQRAEQTEAERYREQMEMEQRKLNQPQVLGSAQGGWVAYDPTTQTVTPLSKGMPTPSTAAKMAVEAGLTPGTPEYQSFIRQYAQKAGGTSVTLDLQGTADEKYAETSAGKLAEIIASQESTAREAEQAANTLLSNYNRLYDILPKITTGGGTFGELERGVQRELNAIFPDAFNEQTSMAAVAEAIGRENQFTRTQILKGAISEKEQEMAFLQDPNVLQAPEGRVGLLAVRTGQNRKAAALARLEQRLLGDALVSSERKSPAQIRAESEELAELTQRDEYSFLSPQEAQQSLPFFVNVYGEGTMVLPDENGVPHLILGGDTENAIPLLGR